MLIGFNTLAVYKAGADVSLYSQLATKADELGFDSMWTGHHIAFPSKIDATYPYAANGVGPHDPRMHRIDPWTLFAHLAAQTRRLRFGTGVYILPLVNPFVTARAVTTADALSEGRIIFGIGVGWNAQEYAIVGEDFRNRGERADEIIEILKRLWTEDTISHQGKHYPFEPLHFEPKPVQKPHPKLIYGGASPAALQRAARLDGCYLPVDTEDHAQALVADLLRRRKEQGIEDPAFEVTTGVPTPLDRNAVERFADIGVSRLLFEVGTNPLDGSDVDLTAPSLLANLERVAAAVL